MNLHQATAAPPGISPRCDTRQFAHRIRAYTRGMGRSAQLPRQRKSTVMTYSLDWEPDGILVRYAGNLGAGELIHATRQIQADGRFDEARYLIHDISEISGHRLSDEGLRELSAINYGAYVSQPNCRIVFVTTDTALAAQLETVLTANDMASYEITCQPTLTAARDWLDSQPQLHVMSNIMGFRVR